MNKKSNKSDFKSLVVSVVALMVAAIALVSAVLVSAYEKTTNESKSSEGFKKLESSEGLEKIGDTSLIDLFKSEIGCGKIDPSGVMIKVKISDFKYQHNGNEISLIPLKDYVVINDEMKYFDPTNNEYFLILDVIKEETVVSLLKDDSKTCVYKRENQDGVFVESYIYDISEIAEKIYDQDEEYTLSIHDTDNSLSVYLESRDCSILMFSEFFYN